ncbi:MAG: cytochrome b5 domain-containing protein [Cellvibrionaceae bacterium]
MSRNLLISYYRFLVSSVLFLAFSAIAQENASTIYSVQDVSKHNSPSDCWLIIRNKVYDVTHYLSLHPSSPGTIEPWCGSIANDGMETKGFGDDHSEEAYALLEDYLIGEIK